MKNAIVFCTNDNQIYVEKMINSINSFFHNNHSLLNSVETFIISDNILNLDKISPNIKYTILNDLTHDYSQLYQRGTLNKYAYFRWEIFVNPIFKDFDNILYLDCDTEIVSDIGELFNTQQKNGLYFVNEIYTNVLLNQIGKCNMPELYVNSGVMLLTPKLIGSKFMEDIFQDLFFCAQNHKFYLCDQDAMNFIIRQDKYINNIKLLDCRYNYCWQTAMNLTPIKNAKIIHYVGGQDYHLNYITL